MDRLVALDRPYYNYLRRDESISGCLDAGKMFDKLSAMVERQPFIEAGYPQLAEEAMFSVVDSGIYFLNLLLLQMTRP